MSRGTRRGLRLSVLWLGLPPVIGGVISWSWWGAATAFLASFVGVSFLHHVTWSITSICHLIGSRPFTSRDNAANLWPLAILPMGESWHNSHHADPTCARHGVPRGRIDISAGDQFRSDGPLNQEWGQTHLGTRSGRMVPPTGRS